MQKFAKGIMYTFGGGVLVAAGYALGHLAFGKGDVTSGAAGIAFGIGCVLGLLFGVRQNFE